jgi:phage shock protein A
MSVLNRLSDIINANLNATLDKAEDPEKMLRLITQEMQDTLALARTSTARNLAERKALQTQMENMQATAKGWQDRAATAINHGRDDLAKAALAENRKLDEAMAALQAELQQLDASTVKLQADSLQLENKLQQARVRQKAMIMRGETARSRLQVKQQLSSSRYADNLVKFEACERRLDDMEGQLEAWELGNANLADEFRSMEEESLLDADLAALKARLAAGTSAASATKAPAQQAAQGATQHE